MRAESLRILPRFPVPQIQSPYIDSREFDEIEKPESIPDMVWDNVNPLLVESLKKKIKSISY